MCPTSESGGEPGKLIRETFSSAETEALAADIAARLRAGDIVLLCGEVGTGKTTFVRGLVRALGISEQVNSPTFGIGHRYVGEQISVSHLDLYRLGELTAQDETLIDDYLSGEEIALIEWPQIAQGRLPDPRLEITLTHLGGDRRRIEVSER
jgi:tRNA threonylcarbamoyladenosine biosynthesis protein TsaE